MLHSIHLHLEIRRKLYCFEYSFNVQVLYSHIAQKPWNMCFGNMTSDISMQQMSHVLTEIVWMSLILSSL